MNKFGEVLRFIYDNRRAIGVMVGAALTMAGFPDHAKVVENVSTVL